MGHSRDSYTASNVLLIPTNHAMGVQLWLIREYIYNHDIQDCTCGILGRLTLFGVCDILALVIKVVFLP